MFCSSCGTNNLNDAQFCKSCGAAMSDSESGPLEYAGFWARFAAGFLDGIILIVIQFVILFFIGLGAVVNSGPTGPALWPYILGYIISAAYFTSMESGPKSATFGKRVLGIRVLDTDGERLSTGRALGRWFAHFFSTITCLIGYLIQPFTSRKQALHDFIAGTIVVNDDSKKGSSTGVVIIMAVAIVGFLIVIGIVASVAIPQYQAYLTKARMSGAMMMGDQVTKKVGEYYLQAQKIPGSVEEAGFVKGPDQRFYQAEIDPANAIVTITFVNSPGPLNNGSLVFTPTLEPDRTVSWHCASRLATRFLPLKCQHLD